jgi:dsRNA-specific ribonuclease
MLSDRMSAVRINDVVKVRDPASNEETLVFDPFNPVNKEITEPEVRQLLTRFGIPESAPIQNMALYRRAFVHKSYVRRPDLENLERGIEIVPKPEDCMALKTKSNDRLEFVGDGVLECITKYYLYERFPKNDEGFMTDTKIALVKNDAIGQIALDIGLHKWYILSKNAEQKNTRNNVKKLGNLFEAFMGAMFLDFNKIGPGSGFHLCQTWLVNLFETPGLIPWNRIIETNENYKNQLQVIIQKEFKTVPLYLELPPRSESTSEAQRNFPVGNSPDGVAEVIFRMGVFLSLGQPAHQAEKEWQKALPLSQFTSWQQVHDQAARQGGKVLILLGEGTNRIKKKAEQTACQKALDQTF